MPETIPDQQTICREIKRPWQGVLLAAIHIAAAAQNGFLVFGFFFFGGINILTLFFVAISILNIFIIIGHFEGRKWTVYASIAFSLMYIISSFAAVQVHFFAIGILLLWPQIICLKHPCYNQRKNQAEKAAQRLSKTIKMLQEKGLDNHTITQGLVEKGWEKDDVERLIEN